jgi:transglutaminase-like putative cysteine protease
MTSHARVFLIVLLVLGLVLPARAAPEPVRVHARIDSYEIDYRVAADLTYTAVSVRDDTLLTARGLELRDRAAFTFHPDTQSVDVVEAWTTEPDGERVPVTPDNIFTRPSAASEQAPGFTSTQTTTVLFPRLREGARVHVKWRFTQRVPAMTGFNSWDDPPPLEDVAHMQVRITAPAAAGLHWAARGYAVQETEANGERQITATIDHTPPEEPERNMVNWSDFRPVFLATSLSSLEELGAIYHRQSAAQATPTPAVAALAARIAHGRTGLAAARAVYDYVARRIRYVAVYLDPDAGWVPHPAEEVMRNGYGDCKDHVVLMQALLAALGIKAEAAVIDWGTAYQPMPLWTPWQFNHAIIYLPDYDIYANPTNPYAPFEALDRRLSGKLVVIATADGRVAHTPASVPASNTYRYEATLTVQPDGTIEGQGRMTAAPRLESDLRGALADTSSPRDLAERMLAATAEGGAGELRGGDPHDLDTPFVVSATWQSPHGVPLQGPLAYLTVPVGIDFKRIANLRHLLGPDRVRRHPVLAGALDYQWTYKVILPPGRTATTLPPAVDVQNTAGAYTASYELAGSELRVTRHLVVFHDVTEPAAYPDLEALIYAPLDDSRSVIPLAEREAER